jgi:RNA polymerase sigma-70 factor (ECF subfamily)
MSLNSLKDNSTTVETSLVLSEDDNLLERMKHDDVDAYRILVEKHIDHAYAIAMRMTKNQADAEDVTQDAFVKSWVNRHRWETGRAKFSTWLYRVIVNRAIDLQRLPKSEWLENVDEPIDEQIDALSFIHRQQVNERLDIALQRLPDQQRIAIILSYFEDMNNTEVAEVIGTTVSAVESLLKRGRKRLRELLKRSEDDVRKGFEL